MTSKSDAEHSVSRSEFVFCYDARMCNPNGDPDENRPRVDRLTGRNIVTEFRLKRTIRDYLQSQMGESIFLRAEVADEKGNIKTIDDLAKDYIDTSKKGESLRDCLLRDHIDMRLFGLLFAVEKVHFKQTGPIQFALGQSLNRVDEIPIRMTRVVPTREEAKAGAFGEKSVLRYSFIVFHGFLNNKVAEEVNLSENDVSAMMKAMWFGTTDLSTTSKYGQKSRLLVRIAYNKPYAYIGDLDKCLSLGKRHSDINLDAVEDMTQITLDVSALLGTLSKEKALIDRIEWACDEALLCKTDEKTSSFSEIIAEWGRKNSVTVVNLTESWGETKEGAGKRVKSR